jgi:uncharacterized protein (TIGR03118 family)
MTRLPTIPSRLGTLFAAAACVGLVVAGPHAARAQGYVQTDLVTDNQAALAAKGWGPAAYVDPNLVNPWGIDKAPGGPWVVANAGFPTGAPGPVGTASLITSYNGSGAPAYTAPITSAQNAGAGSGGLTGLVYNGSTSFVLPDGSPAQYLFSNLDGSISGWNSAEGSTSVEVVPGRTGGNAAKYSGLNIGVFNGQSYIYAANHQTGAIDVYNSSFQRVSLGAGTFVDPNPNPSGLLPYNVENINGNIWVTYAAASAATAPVGSGFVDEYTSGGVFIRRFATGGDLASPWAISLAPSDFGPYSGDILVGNFTHNSYGYISAYDPTSGAFEGLLSDDGTPIAIDGLWDIDFGDGGVSGPTNTLYFAAGIDNEQYGLFGTITAVPEPATWALLILGVGLMGAQLRRRRALAA